MNKNGFTLLEIILVIIISGLIILIAVPNIQKIINSSEVTEAQTIEKMLIKNLELYNKVKEKDIWCSEDTSSNNCITVGTREVTYDELLTVNSGIKMGNCLINKDKGLIIKKDIGGSYSYAANIVCSKDFKNSSSRTTSSGDINNKNIYYETK